MIDFVQKFDMKTSDGTETTIVMFNSYKSHKLPFEKL